jgi:alanine dehydrogenase
MLIGCPKEIKVREYRVGLVPSSVRELIAHGHKVMMQKDAGIGIGVTDAEYEKLGATIISTAEEIFAKAEMIVKVKEPQANECKMLREGQLLYTYLHLAPDPEQTKGLIASRCTAIAYETVTDDRGALPLLAPMSEVAGRLSIQVAAHALEKRQGGSGILLGGVPGVKPATVVVIGGGVSGIHAARMALGMGANVIIMDKSLPRLRELDAQFGSFLTTVYANAENIEKYALSADVIVGAVLIPGGAAPKLISRAILKKMRPGSVLVDISIDQGGCFEASHPTTHDNPTFVEEGIIHYCVANMPGAVPRTSAFALNNATLPFALALADKGPKKAMLDDPHLLNGLNVHKGHVTYEAVAKDLGLPYKPAREALES